MGTTDYATDLSSGLQANLIKKENHQPAGDLSTTKIKLFFNQW